MVTRLSKTRIHTDTSVALQGPVNYAAASGTDTYTATPTPAFTAYVTGAHYFISFTNANTSTTPTLNLNSLGAKTIVKEGTTALAAGDIPAGHKAILTYDGTYLVLMNPKAAASGTTASVSSSFTVDSTYNRKTIYVTASITVTMPAATSLVDGFELTVINTSGSSVIITTTGLDNFGIVSGTNALLNNIYLPGTPNYNYVTIKGNGSNRWLVTSHKIESWSSDITPAQSTVHTFAHGLGVKPTKWRATAKCTTAVLNYSVGDEIEVTSGANTSGSLLSLYADATNIGLVLGGGWPPAFNKTTTGGSTIDGTNWRFVLKAEI